MRIIMTPGNGLPLVSREWAVQWAWLVITPSQAWPGHRQQIRSQGRIFHLVQTEIRETRQSRYGRTFSTSARPDYLLCQIRSGCIMRRPREVSWCVWNCWCLTWMRMDGVDRDLNKTSLFSQEQMSYLNYCQTPVMHASSHYKWNQIDQCKGEFTFVIK